METWEKSAHSIGGMKAFFVILLVIFMFLACATFGYFLAQKMPSPTPAEAQNRVTPNGNFEEHHFLIVQVDRLDIDKPNLVQVWFISLYFVQDSSPTITFGQMYSPNSSHEASLNLQKAFAIDGQGEPGKPFWNAVSEFGFEFEAYFLVDQLATQYILQWVNGAGDYTRMMNGTEDTRAVLQQTCDSLGRLARRESAAFDWTVIAPAHFASSIRMEKAMDYWDHITREQPPPRCDVILTP